MHFKLNGWHRLGIVLSALWAIWPFLYVGIRDTDLPEAFRTPDCYLISFGPILLAWPLAYLAVYTFNWVKRGFQKMPAQAIQAAPEAHAVSESNHSAPPQTESVADQIRTSAQLPPKATGILADDLSPSFRSLKVRWIVCLVSAILFSIFRLLGAGLLGLPFALVGAVYSVSCLIYQMKVLRNLKAKGVQANYWYVLMLVGLLLLVYGTVIEVGCFLLYARGINRRLAHAATA